MGLKINFDTSGNPEIPSFILAYKDGRIIGELNNISKINLHGSLKDGADVSLTISKEHNGIIVPFWNDVTDFKIVFCKEWSTWFEINVNKKESTETIKILSLSKLGDAECSQIRIYDTEINTEDDIAREDYKEPTIFYNPSNPDASLLHRLMKDKAPHYSIRHVDPSICEIQRTFQFNDRTLDECFTEIEDELDIIFIYDSDSNDIDNGITINRTISVYDMLSSCKKCGYRGEFTIECPECKSKDIYEGYGDDTIICIDSDCLSNELEIQINHESVKNCYRMSAGDDLMTSAIKSCNPNGSLYLWNISNDMKNDMDEKLIKKIESYQVDCNYYQKTYSPPLQKGIMEKYNELIQKYVIYKKDLSEIGQINGYAKIMESLWNSIDLQNFLEYELMPELPSSSSTTAKEQADLLIANMPSPVSVVNLNETSVSAVQSAILNFAKLIINNKYKVSIVNSSLEGNIWTGSFMVVHRTYNDDNVLTSDISITISDDYETYIKQKIEKRLENNVSYTGRITSLFNLNLSDFKKELCKYCRKSLIAFNDACSSCIEILIEQGINNNETWAGSNPSLYQSLYLPYLDKQSAIQNELKTRELEINTAKDIYNQLIIVKNNIQSALNFEEYLGQDLWRNFNVYRREDTYSNDNYISDGLSNAEMFKNAFEFIEKANMEIQKVSLYRHKINTDIKNLMVIHQFQNLKKYFQLGNWIRIKDNDGKIYKMRLLEFNIDFDDLTHISVVFSDAVKIYDGSIKIKNIINKTSSIVNVFNNNINNSLKEYESVNDQLTNEIIKNENSSSGKVDSDNVIGSINSSISSSLISADKINLQDMFNAFFTISNVDLGVGKYLKNNHFYVYYDDNSSSDNNGNNSSGGSGSGDDKDNNNSDTTLASNVLYENGITSESVGDWDIYQFLYADSETGNAETLSIFRKSDNYLYIYEPLTFKITRGSFVSRNKIDIGNYNTINIKYSFYSNKPTSGSTTFRTANIRMGIEKEPTAAFYDGYSGYGLALDKSLNMKFIDSTTEMLGNDEYNIVSCSLNQVKQEYGTEIFLAFTYSSTYNSQTEAEIKISSIWLSNET